MTGMMMVSVRVIVVMGAAFGFIEQLAIQIGVGQFFDGGPDLAGANNNALLGKEGQRTPPYAAGNHDVRSLFMQPAGKKPRRVWRSGYGLDPENFALSRIGLHQRKFSAAAKMFMQAAFGGWNGNGHGQCFSKSSAEIELSELLKIFLRSLLHNHC